MRADIKDTIGGPATAAARPSGNAPCASATSADNIAMSLTTIGRRWEGAGASRVVVNTENIDTLPPPPIHPLPHQPPQPLPRHQ